MELKPDDMAWADRYKLLIGSVLPRPIAFVSTISPDGRPNIAPFSFFTAVGSNPMTMLFCPANHPDGSEKDTLRNAKPVSEGGTGEFVVSVVPERLDDVRHRPRHATFCELMKHGLGLDILACPCGHRMLCLWFAAHRRERRRDPLRREGPRPSAPRQGLA